MNSELELQLNKEYERLCSIIGDASYRIKQYQELIETTKKQIDTINSSLGMIQKSEKKHNV